MRTITNETCDRCGPSVRAAVLIRNIPCKWEDRDLGIVRSGKGELTYCGHCYDLTALLFAAEGYTVTDYRLIYGGVAV